MLKTLLLVCLPFVFSNIIEKKEISRKKIYQIDRSDVKKTRVLGVFDLNLEPTAYSSNIQSIRDAFRGNANIANVLKVNIKINEATCLLYLNAAFESRACIPAPNASLYVVGFKGGDGKDYLFNIEPFPNIELKGLNSVTLSVDGSYRSLGYASSLPIINKAELETLVRTISGFKGAVVSSALSSALTKIIIMTCEASRFKSVETDVYNMLRSSTPFDASTRYDMIKRWNTTLLGDNNF
ncbi:ribosome-inactivating family protein [Flavobacterium oreochromis]|uniref:Ribosome-inactivating family protein n=1 Tax=Flavobacterium oreochromis TaxID=2906078 RepID=A0ABW8P5N6_9FLAO|nr:ribosome-inactivating family protein [Flavobacterium oreochromis]OWP76361.1 hypothetical protein BWG23_08350 [Flavobacterium oreochromis]POR22076.1 hypothetical protein BWK58_11465 [Flavobacterium columnare]